MSTKSHNLRWATWLISLAGALALSSGCTRPQQAAAPAKRSCCLTNVAAAPSFSDKSLYQLESSWTNDTGKAVQLGDLRGRVQLVVMFFASCTYACPILVHDLQRIEAAIPPSIRNEVGVTLVTIDPERDTPRALQQFRLSRALPSERWTLLRGTAEDTLELALLLGVKYKRETNGQFSHSNLVTLLNERGEIIYQLAGLNQSIDDAVRHVVDAARSTTASFHSQE